MQGLVTFNIWVSRRDLKAADKHNSMTGHTHRETHTRIVSIRNIYSHVPAKTLRRNRTHTASIKHPIRPHPIISESTSSLTSRYKTLTHLGVCEHTPQCHYSSSNRFVRARPLLWVYMFLSFLHRWRLYKPRSPHPTPVIGLPSLSERAVLNL